MIGTLVAILLYLHYVMMDGDHLNDWLTHMPAGVRNMMIVIGQGLAHELGL